MIEAVGEVTKDCLIRVTCYMKVMWHTEKTTFQHSGVSQWSQEGKGMMLMVILAQWPFDVPFGAELFKK